MKKEGKGAGDTLQRGLDHTGLGGGNKFGFILIALRCHQQILSTGVT